MSDKCKRHAGRPTFDPLGVKRKRISATIPPEVAEYAKCNGGYSLVIEAAILSTPAFSIWKNEKEEAQCQQ